MIISYIYIYIIWCRCICCEIRVFSFYTFSNPKETDTEKSFTQKSFIRLPVDLIFDHSAYENGLFFVSSIRFISFKITVKFLFIALISAQVHEQFRNTWIYFYNKLIELQRNLRFIQSTSKNFVFCMVQINRNSNIKRTYQRGIEKKI